jgi:hypothetical protein
MNHVHKKAAAWYPWRIRRYWHAAVQRCGVKASFPSEPQRCEVLELCCEEIQSWACSLTAVRSRLPRMLMGDAAHCCAILLFLMDVRLSRTRLAEKYRASTYQAAIYLSYSAGASS